MLRESRLIMRSARRTVNFTSRKKTGVGAGLFPERAQLARAKSYFTVRMYFARVLASSALTVPLGGMGTGPQTPVEPPRIFFER